MNIAVILENGFEEMEALSVVDILRRLDLKCDIVSRFKTVTGSHNISVSSDKELNENLLNYDFIVLPGGQPGSNNLKDNKQLIELLKLANQKNKYICAICAAPIALEEADLLKNKNFTCYPSYKEVIKQGNYIDEMVVVDENIITSQGPSTAFEFAFEIAKLCNKDTTSLKEGMLYTKFYRT